MNLIIPQNIFSAIFALALPNKLKEKILIKESSLISKNLEENKGNVALIPSLDLLKHNELFVSDKIAISFDGVISNSYFYFVPEQTTLNKILLRGDLSSNDLILSKILFPEQFGVEPEFALDVQPIDFENNNYLVSGLENESFPLTQNGISFSEQIIEMVNLPYVNFVLASYDEDALIEIEKELLNLPEEIEKNITELIRKLNLDSKVEAYLLENFQSVYYDFTDNEKEALKELLQLPYYHGITEDIIEVKFV
jgi:hypothetical protein